MPAQPVLGVTVLGPAKVAVMSYNQAPPGWWREFVLATPARTAKLAVVRANGAPHVAPVWVDLDGDQIILMTSLLRWATRIGGRYMGEDQAEAYGKRNAVPPEMVVRVTPVTIVAQVDVAS